MNARLEFTVDSEGVVRALFYQTVLDARLSRVKIAEWRTAARVLLPPDEDIVLNIDANQESATLLRMRGLPVALNIGRGDVTARIGHRSDDEARAILQMLQKALPVAASTEQQQVPFTFWTFSNQGPQSVTRMISVPT